MRKKGPASEDAGYTKGRGPTGHAVAAGTRAGAGEKQIPLFARDDNVGRKMLKRTAMPRPCSGQASGCGGWLNLNARAGFAGALFSP